MSLVAISGDAETLATTGGIDDSLSTMSKTGVGVMLLGLGLMFTPAAMKSSRNAVVTISNMSIGAGIGLVAGGQIHRWGREDKVLAPALLSAALGALGGLAAFG